MKSWRVKSRQRTDVPDGSARRPPQGLVRRTLRVVQSLSDNGALRRAGAGAGHGTTTSSMSGCCGGAALVMPSSTVVWIAHDYAGVLAPRRRIDRPYRARP